jgi:hypothetical protein
MSFSGDLKSTKMAKVAAVVINIADATSAHSPMIIYVTMWTKRRGSGMVCLLLLEHRCCHTIFCIFCTAHWAAEGAGFCALEISLYIYIYIWRIRFKRLWWPGRRWQHWPWWQSIRWLIFQAEELMRKIEKEEEQVAYDDPDKKIFHLCIVNLVIG